LAYLSYDIEFDQLEDLFDLVKPVDICLRFVSSLGTQVKAWNFSKQYNPSKGEIHPHLSLRLKVLDEPQAKKLIEKTAATIANEGKLRMFVGPTMWQEDDVSIKAQEASSECAARLAKLLSRKDSEITLEQVSKHSDWDLFVIQLLLKVLDLSGFRVYIRREYRKQFKVQDSQLDKIANDLASVWWKIGSITDPDGVDEFVHSFLTLTASSVSSTEKLFEKFVLTSGIYNGIFNLRKQSSS
jgi:hypothetical protein